MTPSIPIPSHRLSQVVNIHCDYWLQFIIRSKKIIMSIFCPLVPGHEMKLGNALRLWYQSTDKVRVSLNNFSPQLREIMSPISDARLAPELLSGHLSGDLLHSLTVPFYYLYSFLSSLSLYSSCQMEQNPLVQLQTIVAARTQVDCLLEDGKPLIVIFIPNPLVFPCHSSQIG